MTIPMNSVIGKIKVEEQINHTETFEYAAWYRTHVSDVGEFDLHIGKADHRELTLNNLYFWYEMPSTITGNDFSARLCGVLAGNSSRINDEIGQRSSFKSGFRIESFLDVHNNRICLDDVDGFLDFLTELASDYIKYHFLNMPARVQNLGQKVGFNGTPSVGESTKYDDFRYDSIKYSAAQIALAAGILDRVHDRNGWFVKAMKSRSLVSNA